MSISTSATFASCVLDPREPSAAAELVDEIRTVTVLADVAGSMEMAARPGLESVKLLIDRLCDRIEGFEQEILQVHAELSALVGDDESAERCRSRAREEIDRRAQFIESEPVRRRFLEHVGRIAAKLAAALVVDLALPPAAEERDGA